MRSTKQFFSVRKCIQPPQCQDGN